VLAVEPRERRDFVDRQALGAALGDLLQPLA
jgi:hypothetical protein